MGKVVFENETTSFLRLAWPRPELAHLISYYFEVDATRSPAPVLLTGLPAVNTLLAIDLMATGSIGLMGHLTQCVTGSYTPGSKRFYAKLKPGAFGAFFPFAPAELENNQVAVHRHWRHFSTQQFAGLPSFRHRVDWLEQYLLQQFHPFQTSHQQQVVNLFSAIFSTVQYGRADNLQELCKKHHITYASLRRYFIDQVGVSPKYSQKVTRFKMALQAYRNEGYNFHHADYGYTDFSHFCRDARLITGKAPLEL